MPVVNQEMIRNTNRRLVLEYIVNNPPISRADLAKQLQLTKATISNIVQELLDRNLILEIGSAKPPWAGNLFCWNFTSTAAMPLP